MNSELRKVESLLRSITPSEKILNNERRVQCITGLEITETLTKAGYSQDSIKQLVEALLDRKILVKGKVSKANISLALDMRFSRDSAYIWIHEKHSRIYMVIAAIVFFVSTALIMFQVWPARAKRYAIYAIYPLMAFFVAMMVLGVIRLVVFCITFFTNSPGIWLFPNLFADVGIIDSFIPVWEYHGVDTKPKKKEE